MAIHGLTSNFDQSATTPDPIRVCENQVKVRADRDLAHSLIIVVSIESGLKPPRWSLRQDGLGAQRMFRLCHRPCSSSLRLPWTL